ncbi:MAG: hypothetical protein ABIL22_07760 [candidate division WOR-3 bacterium]
MAKIPKFLKGYFWEVNSKDIDLKKHRIYILKRIMEYGDEKAVAWLLKNFKKSEIANVLINCRGFSLKSANYWALVLNLPPGKVRCLKKPLLREQKKIWSY